MMKLRRFLLSLLILCGPFAFTVRADWFLNTRGPDQQATITRFTDSGLPVPFAPSIVEPGAWLAWPSAVALPGGGVRVYASRFDGARWSSIVAWEQDAGASEWRRLGAAITATAAEPYGIATSRIAYDEQAGYWKAWWVRLNSAGVGDAVIYATSWDGLSWYRNSWPVYTPSTYHDAAGFALDYACKSDITGLWHLFLTAYPAGIGSGAAFRVSSTVSWGPYGWAEPMMSDAWWAYPRTITAGKARTGLLTVDETDGLEAGGAAIVTVGQQITTQLVTITAVDTARRQVLLRSPLEYDVAGWTITPIEHRFISPSYVRENADGSWSGIFTGYNPVSNIVAEYTFAARSPAPGGAWSWTIDRDRPAPIFAPIIWAGLYSTENPARVSSGVSCSE